MVLSSLDFDRSESMWFESKHTLHNGLYFQSLIWKSSQTEALFDEISW